MRALVTGGAGFIGSAIVRALLARGDHVRVLDNLLTSTKEHVPPGAEFLFGDIRSPDDIRAATDGVDTVFHFAAIRSVGRALDDPILANTCNAEGTLQVLLAARAYGVRRVIVASSCAVYGDTGAQPAREDQPLAPTTPYASSKIAAEQYAHSFVTSFGMDVVTLRYATVFGVGQPPESRYSAAFPAFTDALTAGRAPVVEWDGEQTRDFVAIDDAVRAALLAADAGAHVAGEIVNIGSGHPRSINEVLRSVAAACGTWIDPEFKPRRAGDSRQFCADISRARAVLGFEPAADFDAVVRDTVAWFRSGRAAPARGAHDPGREKRDR